MFTVSNKFKFSLIGQFILSYSTLSQEHDLSRNNIIMQMLDTNTDTQKYVYIPCLEASHFINTTKEFWMSIRIIHIEHFT